MNRLICIFVFIIFLVQNRVGWGDVVWLVDREAPYFGTVLGESEQELEFRVLSESSTKVMRLAKKDIKLFLKTVDPQKLEALDPSDLRAYLDYAEVLSGYRDDPYAMQTCKRLALISARWGGQNLRSSSFSLLISLSTGKQKQELVRLAYVFDPTFKINLPRRTSAQAVTQEQTNSVVRIIRKIRQGESDLALRLLDDENNRAIIERVRGSHPELANIIDLRGAASSKKQTLEQVFQLLQWELFLSNGESIGRKLVNANDWSSDAKEPATAEIEVPEFENVLGFETARTIFRGGIWTKPNEVD